MSFQGCLNDEQVLRWARGVEDDDSRAHLEHCVSCIERVRGRKHRDAPTEDGAGRAVTVPASPAPLPANDPLRLQKGQLIGRYVILEPLGEGGMGVVYSAFDPELNRRVALKFLLPPGSAEQGAEHRARMLREAQALAQLSHPNVIGVHDVGSWEHSIFLAMELVEGETLRSWMRARVHSWREVVKVFLAAGEGLAAAHGAGLVHRDFKPGNVLLGKNGRICVLDFGLAKLATAADPALPAGPPQSGSSTEESRSGSASTSLLDRAVTRVGARVGTLRYMAPEQMEGRPVDARSDQFSFCVSLHEALYGVRPFAGNAEDELTNNVLAGRLVAPPPGAGVPPWVRRAVLKGLSIDPAQRFPSMPALLKALADDPWPRRRRALTLSAGALVVAGLAFGVTQNAKDRSRLCRGSATLLEPVWSSATQARIEQAFAAAAAADTWPRVKAGVEAYLTNFTAQRQQACEATHVRGEQSEEVLALRLACLDERLTELGALTQVLMTADSAVAARAVTAVTGLTPVTDCADVKALTALERPPTDEATRAKVAALDELLAQVQADVRVGRAGQAKPKAAEAVAAARALQYRSKEGEALLYRGLIEQETESQDKAVETLKQAMAAAQTKGGDSVVARAAIQLGFLVGYRLNRPVEGRDFLEFGGATIERMGGDPWLEMNRLRNLGHLEFAANRYEAAGAYYDRAYEVLVKSVGKDSPRLTGLLTNITNNLKRRLKYDEALRVGREALALTEKTLGSESGDAGELRLLLGDVHRLQGDFQSAKVEIDRGLAIKERLGQRANVANWRITRYFVLEALNDYDGALATLEASERGHVELFGEHHPETLGVRIELGELLLSMGQLARAEKLIVPAIAELEKLPPKERAGYADPFVGLARLRAAQKRWAEALEVMAFVERSLKEAGNDASVALDLETLRAQTFLQMGRASDALAATDRWARVIEGTGGAFDAEWGALHLHRAKVFVALGRPQEAVEAAELALKHDGASQDRALVADVKHAAAQALWLRNHSGDRARARTLAQEAEAIYGALGRYFVAERQKVARWLEGHGAVAQR
jgi:tetratricopeptide (TPR) repeat protein